MTSFHDLFGIRSLFPYPSSPAFLAETLLDGFLFIQHSRPRRPRSDSSLPLQSTLIDFPPAKLSYRRDRHLLPCVSLLSNSILPNFFFISDFFFSQPARSKSSSFTTRQAPKLTRPNTFSLYLPVRQSSPSTDLPTKLFPAESPGIPQTSFESVLTSPSHVPTPPDPLFIVAPYSAFTICWSQGFWPLFFGFLQAFQVRQSHLRFTSSFLSPSFTIRVFFESLSFFYGT